MITFAEAVLDDPPLRSLGAEWLAEEPDPAVGELLMRLMCVDHRVAALVTTWEVQFPLPSRRSRL